MLTIFGVHPGAAGWHVAAMNFRGADQPPGDEEIRTADVPAEIAAKGFFASYQRFVPELSGDDVEAEWDDSVTIRRLVQQVKMDDLASIYYEQAHDYGWSTPAGAGICHPYDAPPLIRRALPVLFDGHALSSDGLASFNLPPRETKLPDGAKLAAIESPLAGCLDLVARGEIATPGNYLLLTGSCEACELTAVRIRREGDELSLQVILSRVCMEDKECEREISVQLALMAETGGRTPAVRHEGHFARPKLCVFGEHLARWIPRLAAVFGLSDADVVRRDESRLAVGAARYAAWCLDQSLHGCQAAVKRLRVEHVVPHDLGLLCAGTGGSMYWHRLYRAGERLPERPSPVPITGDAPGRIMFAERRALAPGGSWIEQRLWRQHELRRFTAVRLDLPDRRPVKQLAVRLIQPSGQLAYRWSDPQVEVRAI